MRLLRNDVLQYFLRGLWLAFALPSAKSFFLSHLPLQFFFVLEEKPLLKQNLLVLILNALEHIVLGILFEAVCVKQQCCLFRITFELFVKFGCLVASTRQKDRVHEVAVHNSPGDVLF